MLIKAVKIAGKKKDQKILAQYKKEKPWGMAVSLDLKKCQLGIINNKEKIKEFVDKLCQFIKMKKFALCRIVNFGQDAGVAGYSMTQLIETSLISGHFANQSKSAYLDIFSCKEFPPYQTAEFCQEFFKAKSVKINIVFRY